MMNKLGILGIVIAIAFVAGIITANPGAEGVSGWQAAVIELSGDISDIELFLEERSDFWEFLEESGEEAFESQVYEVSGVSVISAGTSTGSLVQLRCSEGDTFIDGERNTVLSLDPSKSFPVIRTDFIQVQESDPNLASTSGRVIGADVRANANGATPTFDVPVTITGLCLNPNFLNPDIFNP